MKNDANKAWAIFKASRSLEDSITHLDTLAEEGHNQFKPHLKKAKALLKLLEKEEEKDE